MPTPVRKRTSSGFKKIANTKRDTQIAVSNSLPSNVEGQASKEKGGKESEAS